VGWQACFDPAPTGLITLPATIDTSKNTDQGGLCLKSQPMGWTAPQPDACFIVGGSITVAALTTTTVTGNRPLVLVANTAITVAGGLDIASHQNSSRGPEYSSSDCLAFKQTPDDSKQNQGGGGGAGGSFITQAGNGGQGDVGGPGGSKNGQASLASGTPTHLRGGCAGQEGGGRGPTEAGAGGGGRAVYLLSGGTIVIAATGVINASGGGGSGSKSSTGGSGGGSGGMIVLYSPAVSVTIGAKLVANGGSGSGGADSPPNQRGGDGHDPSLASPTAPTQGGGVNGGDGYPATGNALDGRGGNNNGGGGGGGGGGAGYIRSNKALTGATVSPAASIIP